DRDDVSATVFEFDVLRPVRRFPRGDGDAPHRLLGLEVGVLQNAALVGDVQQIGVHRIGGAAFFLLEVHRYAVLFGVGEQFLPRHQVPFAPRRDDLYVRHQCIGAELEAHLVVALAGRAVGNRVRPGLPGDAYQMLGDQGPGDRGAEQVFALVDGVGAKHREHEIAHEFLAQILDEDLLYAEHLRLLPGRGELFALADIGGEGDDFATVGILQPLEDYGGVQAAGVGEHDFPDLLHG